MPSFIPGAALGVITAVQLFVSTQAPTEVLSMADFWAGYISGISAIIIGSPLDIIKVQRQAHARARAERQNYYSFNSVGSLVRGTAAPLLGYGALNSLLFVSYNQSLQLLGDSPSSPSSLWKVWTAGAVGGLVSFVFSAPIELVKCRSQISADQQSSWSITREIFRSQGLRGLFLGGVVTSLRDSLGFGFYFWSYEGSKFLAAGTEDNRSATALKILLCGGIAGCVSWISIYPLDVIKTRVQTQHQTTTPLLAEGSKIHTQKGAWECAKIAYKEGGTKVFFSGLGVCMIRAFLVNAVQWAVYEWVMVQLQPPRGSVDN